MSERLQTYERRLPGLPNRKLILERILLLVGSLGMLADALVSGAFRASSPEFIWFRLIVVVGCTALLVLSFFHKGVRKNIYRITTALLFVFISLVVYLNYIHGFGFEYVLMLHVAVVVSSIYFRRMRGLFAYLIFTYAIVALASLTAPAHFIPPQFLLVRLILTMACGYGLNMLNRDVIQRLQHSDERFRMLAENGTDLIALHDTTGNIEYANLAAERMLGYGRNEVLGMNAFELIHPDDREKAQKAYYESLFQKGESVQLEYRLICKTGEVKWVEAVGTPLGNETPPRRVLTTSRDISERKQAEAETMKYQENLERINNELDQFAYVVSHDLKAPLRGISNLTTFIEEDLGEQELPEEVAHQLVLMRSRVQQMEQLIEDVLAFSRAGRLPVEWGNVDVVELLQNLLQNLDLPKGYRVELPEAVPPVCGARLHFEQIFSNLISNAWKHHDREEGLIAVRYADAGEFHCFEVADDGPGIAREFHERIFEVFQQLKASDKQRGTGVGLAIVRKIVRSAGGRIELDSDLGKGTTFRIFWPKERKEQPA
jgi:PAS domain S-box-containing protein